MAFHVFVEGATDATPAGVERLASAIAKHYGLAAADLLARLQKGRFRVKGNTDRETADKYRRDLELLGARCTIEEATPESSQRATPLPFPAVRPATPVAGTPVLPPRAQTPPAGSPLPPRSSTPPAGSPLPPRPSTPPAGSPLPPRSSTPPAGSPLPPSRPSTPPAGSPLPPARPSTPPSGTAQYQSGLAAAFSSAAPAASLGALDQDGLSFSLASVDGGDEQAKPAPGGFAPPDGGMSASIGPPPEKPKTADKPAKTDKPKDVPLDLFAPPDAQDAELAVDLAIDELPKPRAGTPPPVAEPTPEQRKSQPALQPRGRASSPAMQVASVDAPSAKRSKLGPLAEPRTRFAAGVLLAILIGFVPAHLVASMREASAYKLIDNKVIATQQLADTPETYAALDRMRTDQLGLKRGEQRNAAIIALAVWALVGGAVAFAWFKKVPWDRLD